MALLTIQTRVSRLPHTILKALPLATARHVFMDMEKTVGISFEFHELWLNDGM